MLGHCFVFLLENLRVNINRKECDDKRVTGFLEYKMKKISDEPTGLINYCFNFS